MRPKSLILILIALGCGLVASIGISQVVERGGDTVEVKTTPIYVAMTDLGIGDELGPKAIKIEEWPNDKIPEGAIRDAAELDGMRPRQPLYAGEPILTAKLANQSDLLGNARRIKKGYRVAAVKVTRESAVAGLIFPGDRVDVMSFVRGSSTNNGPRAETILSNIEVFAINDQIDRVLDGEGNSIDAKTVSLLVKPDQAQQLMYYANLGPLNLALRRPDDEDEPAPAVDLTPAAPVALPAPQLEPEMLVEENRFVMEIFEGGQSTARRFKFNDDGSAEEMTGTTSQATSFSPDDALESPFPDGDSGSEFGDVPPPSREPQPPSDSDGDDFARKIDWSFLSE
jgi:pilus assembly protein CpaB